MGTGRGYFVLSLSYFPPFFISGGIDMKRFHYAALTVSVLILLAAL
jgi:hypothetical protein